MPNNINDFREESSNPEDFSADYKQGWKDSYNSLTAEIIDAINTYEAVIFVCQECGKLAYMVDSGDGLITHLD